MKFSHAEVKIPNIWILRFEDCCCHENEATILNLSDKWYSDHSHQQDNERQMATKLKLFENDSNSKTLFNSNWMKLLKVGALWNAHVWI